MHKEAIEAYKQVVSINPQYAEAYFNLGVAYGKAGMYKGVRIEAEAIRRGLHNAYRIVVLGDGAKWIRGICELRFSHALQIVDLYHPGLVLRYQ